MTDKAVLLTAKLRLRKPPPAPEPPPSLLRIAGLTMFVIAAFLAVFVAGPILYYGLGGS